MLATKGRRFFPFLALAIFLRVYDVSFREGTPPKTSMTMEKRPFEDVSILDQASCWLFCLLVHFYLIILDVVCTYSLLSIYGEMDVFKHITSGGHLKLTLMRFCLNNLISAFHTTFLIPTCVYTDYRGSRGCDDFGDR